MRKIDTLPDTDAPPLNTQNLRNENLRSDYMCDYCKGVKAITLDTDVGDTWIKGDSICNAYGECKIKYCPMCGTKLQKCENNK